MEDINNSHDLRRKNDRLEAQQRLILKKLETIEAHQVESIELLTLFKNTKGFVSTLRGIGILVLWVGGVGGSLSGLLYVIRTWLRGW